MFQMKCPECEKIIRSPLLIELEMIDCPHCRKKVNIENIIVATKSFSIHRQDLLGRIPLYKKLLKEVEIELGTMRKDESASERSKKSMEDFRALLKDLLLGARGSFRMGLQQDFYIEVHFRSQKRMALLNNLSLKGAGLEFVGQDGLPGLKSDVTIHLPLPGHEEPMSILGTIVWTAEKRMDRHQDKFEMGLKFKNMTPETQNILKNFIVNAVAP